MFDPRRLPDELPGGGASASGRSELATALGELLADTQPEGRLFSGTTAQLRAELSEVEEVFAWAAILFLDHAPDPEELSACLEAVHGHLLDGGAIVAGVVASALRRPVPATPTVATSSTLIGKGDALVVARLLELGALIRGERTVGEPSPSSWPVVDSFGYRLISAQKEAYRVLPYAPGDEVAILDLFARSFGVERSVDDWRWKYRENPYGNLRISLGRDPGGEIVSQYTAYPVRIDWVRRSETEPGEIEPSDDAPEPDPEDVQLVHQVGDTMTAPSVRRVGRNRTSLLGRTVRHFYARFCEGQVAFNYGFNTSKIQRFTLRIAGGEKIEEVPYRRLEVGPRLLEAWRQETRYRIRRIERADSRFDRLYQQVRSEYRLLVERDARYLRWRYLDRPDFCYRLYGAFDGDRLAGWSVFARRGRELVWGDALFRSRDVAAAGPLLADAASRSRAEEGPASASPPCDAIVGWFPDRPSWWHDQLLELGFEQQPEPQTLAMLVVPFVAPSPATRLRRELYYTYGDSDLF